MKNVLFRNFTIRRFIAMLVGIIFIGAGVGLFKLSLTGNDPSSAMVMAVGDIFGMKFNIMLLIFNLAWFVVEIAFGRDLIGLGTFANWFFTGTAATTLISIVNSLFTIPQSLVPRLFIMVAGMLVVSFGCALYQTADLGTGPYDSHSIILNRFTKIPYFWCRIFTDVLCVVIALVFHGLIGIGTLVCALGLGPFINFFTIHFARRICGIK